MRLPIILELTGGLRAAPTTPPPDDLGGDGSCDHRSCWRRDATFILGGGTCEP